MKPVIAIVAVVLFVCWLALYNRPPHRGRPHVDLSPPARSHRMPAPRRLPSSTTAVMGLVHPEEEAAR